MLTEVAAEGGFTHEQGLRVLVCLADTQIALMYTVCHEKCEWCSVLPKTK